MGPRVDDPTVHAPELPADAIWLNTPRPLSMRELRGHVVVLDFWTYCCINCMHVLPILDALEKAHAHEPLVVVGVHSAKFEAESHPDRVSDAISRYGVHHPVVVDRDMRIWNAFAIRSWPTLVVVRPNGTIAAVAPGEPDASVLEGFVVRELEAARARGHLATQRSKLGRPTSAAARETTLRFPSKVEVAPDGRIAVSDAGHHRVLVLDGDGKVLQTIGSGLVGWRDGSFDQAVMDDPQGVRWDPNGNALFVCDARAHVVARADLHARTVTTIAGTGRLGENPLEFTGKPATKTALRSPWDVVVDGDRLLVAMAGSHQIAVVDLREKIVAALAGTGAESKIDGDRRRATFAQPSGLALRDHTLFVADSETSSVRAIDLERGEVRTLVGHGLFDFGDVDGPPEVARLQHCIGIALDAQGMPVVADTYNDKLRRVDATSGAVTTLFAGGMREPSGLAAEANGAWIVADTGNSRLLRVDARGARALEITGAPRPREGSAKPAPLAAPKLDTDWFTADVRLDAPLGEGDGEIVITLRPVGPLHLAGGSTSTVSVEVSRRSDLLHLAATRVRTHVPELAEVLAVPIRVSVQRLTSSIESELTLCIDAIVCNEGDDGDPAACIPIRTYARIPIQLSPSGKNEIELEIPLKRV